jgi:ribokinase
MGEVFIVGNAGLDLRLSLPRLPEIGETLLGSDAARAPGGKGLNQAVVAARCGARVHFCAPVGTDAHATEVEHALSTAGFATLDLPHLPFATDFSFLMAFLDGENSIVSSGACAAALTFDSVEPALSGLGAGDILLLQGNLSRDTTAKALAFGRRRGAITLFNPAPLWWDATAVLADCCLVIANRGEAEILAGAGSLRSLGAHATIVTLGAKGCVLTDTAGEQAFPAETIDAVDTTGCGDTFCGVIAAALAAGLALPVTIGLAQKAAALTATRPGAFASLPSRDELQDMYNWPGQE